jgi:hypothetical protein
MSASLPVLSPSVVTVPAGARVAAYSTSSFQVTQIINTTQRVLLFAGAGLFTTSTFASGAVIEVSGGDRSQVFYSVGTQAFIPEFPFQPTPGTLNATGTLTAALVFGGIVTSTTAAAVTATLDTGTIFDAAQTFAIGEYVDWTAINTGGTNAFTVTASTGHTIVGLATVAALTSGRFRTTKTAANIFITYRL